MVEKSKKNFGKPLYQERFFIAMTQIEQSQQSYEEWLKKYDPQASRWLERLKAIKIEVSALDEDALQARYKALMGELRQQGKTILEAGKDWELIYKLNRQSHSMQAPFCDTSGMDGMNMPKRYVVLNNADIVGRVKELMVSIEYPKYHIDGK